MKPGPRSAAKEPIYDVFASKKRGDTLYHIGSVNAPSDELARIYSWHAYDEENWFEMCVVRRNAILPVNRKESYWRPATTEGAPT